MSTILLPGMIGTGSWSTDQRPRNYREAILRMFPDAKATFMQFLGVLPDESTNDPEFYWFEQGLTPLRAVCHAARSASDTTIFITGAETYKNFRAGMAVMNERTREVVWVSSSQAVDANQSSLTVERGRGSTAAAMNANDGLLIIGTFHPEGADVPQALHQNPAVLNNCTQIFRNSYSITGTAQQTKLRTGAALPKQSADAMEQHALQMENAFLFGSRVVTVSPVTGLPMRTTQGFVRFLTTNVFDFSSTGLSESVFDNHCEQIFRVGSSTKLVLAGSRFLNVFHQMVKRATSYQVDASTNVYGISVTKYITPFGTLVLKMHSLLSQSPTYSSSAIVIDTAKVRYRYLQNRDTTLLKNRQGPGVDGRIEEFLTEAGLEVNHESAHAVIHGVTALAS